MFNIRSTVFFVFSITICSHVQAMDPAGRALGKAVIKIIEQKRPTQPTRSFVRKKTPDNIYRFPSDMHEEVFVVACRCDEGSLVATYVYHDLVTGNYQDKVGKTGLHYACSNGSKEFVAAIVCLKKLDPNIQDKQGNTALHYACLAHFFYKEKVAILVELQNIDPNIQNNDGDTPLHIACFRENFQLVAMLMKIYGIDPTIKNSSGLSPLDVIKQGMDNPEYDYDRLENFRNIFRLLNRNSRL